MRRHTLIKAQSTNSHSKAITGHYLGCSLVFCAALLLAACGSTDQEAPIVEGKKAAEQTNNAVDEVIVTGTTRSQGITASRSPIKRAQRFVPQSDLVRERLPNRERYDNGTKNPVSRVADAPVSTFSSDVDTAAYTVMRRYLNKLNKKPPASSIRVEEYVNYFDYNYKFAKSAEEPFSATVWLSPTPWNADTTLMHIGVKGFDIPDKQTPDANIVFLLDVSGSMSSEDKLPLVKKSIELMVNEMGKDDYISIVVYAGAAGVVLEPTPASQKTKILSALDNLRAGGSTAGGAGLTLAYKLAEENFDKEKVNRVILASDGDFNVGTVDNDTLEGFIAEKRKTGIFLTVLGYGGQNYNDVLAQKLAQAGNGVAAYIDTLNEARKVLVTEMRSTVFPIATDLKFQVEFNPAQVSEYRLIGYETRILNEEDFNNDAVDAGDIGSGHTVTALYELALTGSKGALIDQRRYPENRQAISSDAIAISNDKLTDEMAFVKMRYKLPGSSKSDLITMPVTKDQLVGKSDKIPHDARFASAVAAFGQKLGGASYLEAMPWDDIIALAQSAKGDDPYGYRSEFVQLVRIAEKLSSPGTDDLE